MMLAEQSQTWFPTHVQVTVLQARDLNPKGKSGTNDTYTIIQLGKEKYSTSVAEKTLSPTWKEEVSFEFPGLLLQGTPEKYTLHLIVLHRSLVGLDKFLGQVAICLNELFENKSRRQKECWKDHDSLITVQGSCSIDPASGTGYSESWMKTCEDIGIASKPSKAISDPILTIGQPFAFLLTSREAHSQNFKNNLGQHWMIQDLH